MIQSGILYTIDSTTGQSTNKPLKGAWINFVQNDVIKVRTQTHGETGAYSVDVPFGKYTVNLAVGNVTVTMRAGQLFELKSGDNASAFQNWLYSTTADVDDTLLNSFKQIANDISDSANRAESAEKGAKQIETNMQNNSIGNTNGKWLKEGASKSDFLNTFGNYYSQDIMPYLKAGDTGLSYAKHFKTKNTGLDFANTGINENEFLYYEVQRNYTDIDAVVIEFKGYRGRAIYAQAYKRVDGTWTKPVVFYSTGNTTVDTNGFIKKASPIIKLFDDHIEWNQDFKEAPIFEKLAPGIYKISNTHGLAREGWTYEKPRGKDGNTYFKIKVQKLDDGCIVSVHDYFVDYEDVTIIDDVGNKRTVKKQIEVLSQARDIKLEERWIDLRFFEKIYDVTNEPPVIHVPYHPSWGIDPYVPPVVEQIEEDIALEDQRAF